MALFGKEKEDTTGKEEKLLAKYGLENLVDMRDAESVRKIASELLGTGLMELGAKLGGGSEKDMLRIQMYYQRAILEQNFILIRQLDKIGYYLSLRQ